MMTKDNEKEPRKKIAWKRYRGNDGAQRAKRRKQADKCVRMTRDVAKILRIPFVS